MKKLRTLVLGGLVAMVSLLPAGAAGRPEPIAIIYSLAGETSARAPHTPQKPLHLFDRLPAGTTLEIGPGARVALAFVSGLRYELAEGSRVTLGAKDLASRMGPVRSLPRVPPLPRFLPIAKEDRPGPRAGAVRIRSEIITGLHPDQGIVSLSSAIRLRFDPMPGTVEYRVQIVGRAGEVLFRTDTQTTQVSVPSGAIAPGGTYHWIVETLGRPGAVARGEAILTTLDAGRARAREELRSWAQRSGSADDLSLLKGMDEALGLWGDPRDTAEDSCPFSNLGLVVETVAPESAGFYAGLQPGDRLFSWCRAPGGDGICVEHGDLRTPFDWMDFQVGTVQLGGAVLEGVRGTEDRRWHLLPMSQDVTVMPLLHGELAAAFRAGRDREQAGDFAAAAQSFEHAAELASEIRCNSMGLWLEGRAAGLRHSARQWAESDAEYEAALAKARALQATHAEGHLYIEWWYALWQRGDLVNAKRQLETVLLLKEKDPSENLFVVLVLLKLGATAERLEDLEEAHRLNQRAYDLARQAAPGSNSEASAANNLAATTAMQGDLAQAELYMARSLEILEKLNVSDRWNLPMIWNHGQMLLDRGDLAGAETAFLRAKRSLESTRSEGLELATTFHLLGETADRRGDHDAAENLFQRELALLEKLNSDGDLKRERLTGLGKLALLQRQGGKAEEWWRRALAISDQLNPTGPQSASCLVGLAEALSLQDRDSEAKELLQRALTIWQKINPEALDTGAIHLKLGLLLLEEGDSEAAEAHFQTAIRLHELYRTMLPESYQALARLQAKRSHRQEAAATYEKALDALESQGTRLGGAKESQWLYGSSLGDLYFEAAENQMALGHSQEAWEILERGRARGFQELLAQRDLRFFEELPADLCAERRRLAAEYDDTQASLADWTPEQGTEKYDELQGKLRDLRLEQEKIQEKLRKSSTPTGSVASVLPIDLAAARASLDPGTVLLTYAVGESRSYLFVIEAEGVPGPGFFSFPLAFGRDDLASGVEAFRNLLERPWTPRSSLQQHGRHLYDLLVRPAARVLAKADRWLISPDGPLHSLPFAALVSGGTYLAESKPIHIVASAAVYKEIKATRSKQPSTATIEMLAVGDPFYPAGIEKQAEATTNPQVREALLRGLRLLPLPATRSEVKAISGLYPRARILLGSEATEEAIKSLAPRARRLHFACHGLLDKQFPLNSALALSMPKTPLEGHDNGLLQAWEIFEELRLDADLVTLSACDSGLGKEIGGEGLVGLARAFQFAGARSVLASLWGVSDISTARFMQRFYGYLRNGKTKDEALRTAQVDQIRGKAGSSHPFYWAAFQLTGDWR